MKLIFQVTVGEHRLTQGGNTDGSFHARGGHFTGAGQTAFGTWVRL